jgi:hypothetical protein
MTTVGLSLPGGCPPVGSQSARGTFYRLSRPSAQMGETLTLGDWVLPLNTKTSEAYQRHELCDAYAFSVFSEVADLLQARESVPWARKKSIAQIELMPDMGRTMRTDSELGSSHHDWWPAGENIVPPSEVIEARAA